MLHSLLEFLLRSTLIALGTGLALNLMRVRTAAVRHATWGVVMALMLPLPIWIVWGPKAQVPLTLTPLFQVAAASVANTAQIPAALHGQRIAFIAYFVGVVALLFRLAIGTVQVARLNSATCASPITIGWFHPRVILPQSASEWDPTLIEMALVHEGEHARRHDPLVQWLALFIRAVFWFHPLAWWLERRLAALAEEACDAAVLARGFDAGCYAQKLLYLARSVADFGARLSPFVMAMPGGSLGVRIGKIFEAAHVPRVSQKKIAVLATLCTAMSLIIATTVVRAADERVYAGAEVTALPRPIPETQAQPYYPEGPRRERVEGSVTMNLIIGDDGVPRDLQVVKTVDERLNAPAIEAVTKWRFVPGMLQGKPVAVRATIEAHFGLR